MSEPLPLAEAAQRLRRRPGRPRKGARPVADQASGHPAAPLSMRAPAPTVATVWPDDPPPADVRPRGLGLVPRLLGLKASATYLGVSTWVIRAYLAAGRLHRVHLPGPDGGELDRLLLDRQELDRLVEDGKA